MGLDTMTMRRDTRRREGSSLASMIEALLSLSIVTASCVATSCHGSFEERSPCDGVTCSHHGTCFTDGRTAECRCEVGYHASGLECAADMPGADADADRDVDVDVDGDVDGDVEDGDGGDGAPVCVFEVCNGRDDDCDGADDDGFECSLGEELVCEFCGAEGTIRCGDGCTWGACDASCPPTRPDCCSDSCVDVMSDLANCGACGASCGLNPFARCVDGLCL
jgi:hypothetical protein